MKRTIAYFNPRDKAKAKRTIRLMQRGFPKDKYIIEKSKRWGTLDVKMVTRRKKRINNLFGPFNVKIPNFRL